ncbi:hypothetical protein SLEP1_g33510 [Rubroshorea leprosula]|uniref:Uncharacterized protein n=1 Tax=Rubroshorea leprosula TaxID=152421 RepID=A0AAV5KGV6_9ROSI|nr:hypothetical protein SLEP1_g33510 [Rubroshorea leprosula]
MKALIAIFIILSSVLLLLEVSHARNGPREYWESMMGEPMQEEMKQLFNLQGASTDQDGPQKKMVRFDKDFDTRHSFILYHPNDKLKGDPKPLVPVKDQDIMTNVKAFWKN